MCFLSDCQRRNGVVLNTSLLSRLSHKRLMATFQVEAQRGKQDLYRCITLSPRGAAVSNFGELIVRGKACQPTKKAGLSFKSTGLTFCGKELPHSHFSLSLCFTNLLTVLTVVSYDKLKKKKKSTNIYL